MPRTTRAKYLAPAFAALLVSSTPAMDAEMPVHLGVLVDLSGSNPLVASPDAADRIANDAAPYFDRLTEGSRVTMTTFGAYDVTRNPTREIKISARARPDAVRQSLLAEVRNLPDYVRKGTLKPQEQTNIVAALADFATRTDCTAFRTTVLVLTDGIENSQYGQLPPKQVEPIYKGCAEIVFIGINGESPVHTQRLIAEWTRWSTAAGFAKAKMIR
jgi:hypothetical protein